MGIYINVNRTELAGRLTRVPELRKAANQSVCKFQIAVNRKSHKDENDNWVKPETDFIPVEAWGNLAEDMARAQKGDVIWVQQGTLKTSSYEVNGEKRTQLFISAQSLLNLGSFKSNESSSNNTTNVSANSDFGGIGFDTDRIDPYNNHEINFDGDLTF